MKLRAFVSALAAIAIAAPLTAAPIGTAFTYQGVLKDGGTPASGSYNFAFRLYDDEVAGSQVGSDVTLNGVIVTGGLFTVELDFGAVFDGTELWLEIEVDSTTLGTRQNLTPVPYALNAGSLLQTPGDPKLVGSVGIGANPISVFVSGPYAYVVDAGTFDLRVIDVSDPSSPSLTGTLGIGGAPQSVFVSGRYAYVVDRDSDDLKVIDVSDPGAPTQAGSLGIGAEPFSLFVSGRYAYVVDAEPLCRLEDKPAAEADRGDAAPAARERSVAGAPR